MLYHALSVGDINIRQLYKPIDSSLISKQEIQIDSFLSPEKRWQLAIEISIKSMIKLYFNSNKKDFLETLNKIRLDDSYEEQEMHDEEKTYNNIINNITPQIIDNAEISQKIENKTIQLNNTPYPINIQNKKIIPENSDNKKNRYNFVWDVLIEYTKNYIFIKQ